MEIKCNVMTQIYLFNNLFIYLLLLLLLLLLLMEKYSQQLLLPTSICSKFLNYFMQLIEAVGL